MHKASMYRIRHAATGETVCHTAVVARSAWARMKGLLGRDHLGDGEGLLLSPSSGVHTFGMRFPIDILALDAEQRLVGVWRGVGPNKVRGLSARTRAVLELPAGAVPHNVLRPGDQLTFEPVAEA